jgi:programmed cell death 6-interacting protein
MTMFCFSFPAIASGAYEKVCMLFNIAAMQTQIASCQNFESEEGLKTAVKFFQVFLALIPMLNVHNQE